VGWVFNQTSINHGPEGPLVVGFGPALTLQPKQTHAEKAAEAEVIYLHVLACCLRELRQERGLSQEQLVLLSGVSRSEIQYLEHGDRNAKVGTLKRFTDFLRSHLYHLLNATCRRHGYGVLF
jgi:DNA-binding XRE family transcriptional regulator